MKAIDPSATKISFIIVFMLKNSYNGIFGLIASAELIFEVSKLEE
jgi:hypothetical protein